MPQECRETPIRTTNWNNMNFFKRSVRQETLANCLKRRKHQDKIRLIERYLKRFPDYFHAQRVVLFHSRRLGKATIHRLYTEFYSLKELQVALTCKDRAIIKSVINKRINARADAKRVQGQKKQTTQA